MLSIALVYLHFMYIHDIVVVLQQGEVHVHLVPVATRMHATGCSVTDVSCGSTVHVLDYSSEGQQNRLQVYLLLRLTC